MFHSLFLALPMSVCMCQCVCTHRHPPRHMSAHVYKCRRVLCYMWRSDGRPKFQSPPSILFVSRCLILTAICARPGDFWGFAYLCLPSWRKIVEFRTCATTPGSMYFLGTQTQVINTFLPQVLCPENHLPNPVLHIFKGKIVDLNRRVAISQTSSGRTFCFISYPQGPLLR